MTQRHKNIKNNLSSFRIMKIQNPGVRKEMVMCLFCWLTLIMHIYNPCQKDSQHHRNHKTKGSRFIAYMGMFYLLDL